MSDQIDVRKLMWDHPDACILRAAQQAEIDSMRPIGPGVPATAANVPTFLVAYRSHAPIACGGLRPLDSEGYPGEAEVKRMYVVPAERNGRVARYIMQALENTARESGTRTLKIETSKSMMQARRFYEKCGFTPCGVYGGYRGNDHSYCFEKAL